MHVQYVNVGGGAELLQVSSRSYPRLLFSMGVVLKYLFGFGVCSLAKLGYLGT